MWLVLVLIAAVIVMGLVAALLLVLVVWHSRSTSFEHRPSGPRVSPQAGAARHRPEPAQPSAPRAPQPEE